MGKNRRRKNGKSSKSRQVLGGFTGHREQ